MRAQSLSKWLVGLAPLCLAALTAGCSLFGDDWLDKAEKAPSGPQAMWYRVQFEADYGSQRVKIDQMVTCTTTYISGGFLGQSPNSAVTEAYPKTAGVDLADGSRVVVRVPDMCRRNRAFVTAADGDLEMVRGWEEVGSFDVMPLVIWSERSRDPERMESYISRDYYQHPEARFKNAKGTLTLWEVGRIPENVREILAAPPFEPFSPNPWVDPERAKRVSMEERLKGYDREGYHGNGPRYAAYTITEIDSVEEWWAKYLDYAQRIGFRLEDVRNKPEPEPDYETKDVSVWPTASDIMGRWVGDPDFVYADCPRRYIYDLMVGVPRMEQADLLWGQLVWTAAVLAPCLCRGDASPRTLDNQLALEFGQRREYPTTSGILHIHSDREVYRSCRFLERLREVPQARSGTSPRALSMDHSRRVVHKAR